jgi:hypothetical protein
VVKEVGETNRGFYVLCEFDEWLYKIQILWYNKKCVILYMITKVVIINLIFILGSLV